MSYKEYIPSKYLNSIVDTIWIATNNGKEMESRILPDGYVDIIFDLGKEANTCSDNRIRVSGMMTTYRKVVSKKNSETLGARFKTGQFNGISNIPLSEIKNKTINASDLFPKFNYSILEELMDKKNHFEKLQFITDFLTTQVNFSNTNSLELSVCSSIQSNYQKIDLAKLAENHCISLRQLERRFKAIVGVTMKEYHSVIRFNKTIKCISNNLDTSLLNIAFDNGYYDHAHLTKEIHRMSGLNPSTI